MESKHKNALIGALLAVVFVMAVGYAAFAQQLTINGTAEITSKWDVYFNNARTTQTSVACKNGFNNGTTCGSTSDTTNPYGTIQYVETAGNDSTNRYYAVNIDAYLVQPGDEVTFTLNPHNYSTGLNATGTMTVSDTTQAGYTGTTIQTANATNVTTPVVAKKDHIEFTVTPSFSGSLAPGSEDTITVKAKYVDEVTTNEVLPKTKAGITVLINYSQAA